MSDIAMKLRFDADMDKPLVTRRPITLLMQGDALANQIEIHLKQGDAEYNPQDCLVEARLIRNDGNRVKCKGTINGNVVEVELDSACYEISGAYAMFVRLVKSGGGQRRTILRIAGEIESEGDGPVIEGNRVFYTIDELLLQIERMETGTEAMEEATKDARKYAEDAKAAAQMIDGMTVSSEEGETTNATVTEKNGAKHIDFKIRRGEPGYGMRVLGLYATLSALETNVISPAQGDMYLVGTDAPYAVYMYNNIGSQTGWIYLGEAQGAGIGSVAGVRPNADGDIPLKPEDISALGEKETAADAQKLGGKKPEYYEKQENLLDNSNFANPVNRKGKTQYSGSAQYTIDRWRAAGKLSVTIGDGEIVLTCGADATTLNGLRQYIDPEKGIKAGEVLTLACMESGGTLHIGTVTAAELGGVHAFGGNDGEFTGEINAQEGYVNLLVPIGNTIKLAWALLLRGEYTAEDIAYKNREYVEEFLRSGRFFQRVNMRRPVVSFNSTSVLILNVPLLAPLRRDSPSIKMITEPTELRVNGETYEITVTDVSISTYNQAGQPNAIVHMAFSPSLGSTQNIYHTGYLVNMVELELDCNPPDTAVSQ